MKKALLSLAVFGVVCASAFSQTAEDSNEGSRMEYDAANDIYLFKWFAHAGKTYFLLHTDNLEGVWNYLPVVETGNDSVKEWGFSIPPSTPFFIRLQWTSEPAGGEAGDADGDGYSNLAEAQMQSNPLDYYSQPGGMITPTMIILSGNNQSGPPSQSLPQRLTVKVLNAATSAPLVNAPVVFTSTSGEVSRSLARTGTSGRAAVTFTTPGSLGTSTITATASSASVQFTALTVDANALQVPNAPSQFTSVLNPDGSRTLHWKDNSSNEDVFAIWTRNANGQWIEIGTVPANQTTATISANGTLVP